MGSLRVTSWTQCPRHIREQSRSRSLRIPHSQQGTRCTPTRSRTRHLPQGRSRTLCSVQPWTSWQEIPHPSQMSAGGSPVDRIDSVGVSSRVRSPMFRVALLRQRSGTEIAKRRMPLLPIPEQSHILERFGERRVMRELHLQPCEEALRDGVVPAIAPAAHTTQNALLLQYSLVVAAGVLPPPSSAVPPSRPDSGSSSLATAPIDSLISRNSHTPCALNSVANAGRLSLAVTHSYRIFVRSGVFAKPGRVQSRRAFAVP